jgi:hypothetical protein
MLVCRRKLVTSVTSSFKFTPPYQYIMSTVTNFLIRLTDTIDIYDTIDMYSSYPLDTPTYCDQTQVAQV